MTVLLMEGIGHTKMEASYMDAIRAIVEAPLVTQFIILGVFGLIAIGGFFSLRRRVKDNEARIAAKEQDALLRDQEMKRENEALFTRLQAAQQEHQTRLQAEAQKAQADLQAGQQTILSNVIAIVSRQNEQQSAFAGEVAQFRKTIVDMNLITADATDAVRDNTQAIAGVANRVEEGVKASMERHLEAADMRRRNHAELVALGNEQAQAVKAIPDAFHREIQTLWGMLDPAIAALAESINVTVSHLRDVGQRVEALHGLSIEQVKVHDGLQSALAQIAVSLSAIDKTMQTVDRRASDLLLTVATLTPLPSPESDGGNHKPILTSETPIKDL